MPVEILIYIYLGMCAGMILFNIATALLSRRREHRSFRDGIRLELTVSRELDRLAETGAVSERHLRFMERRLRRVNGMAAFDAALECLCVRRPELTRSYLTALNGVTITLAEDYCRRDEIEAAYFPYIIRKYRLLDGQENEALKTMLLDLLHESSIYCRENAMQALYTAGDPAVLVRALRIIDASSLYYHSKLLSDGLLNYTGDTRELADALWEAFDAFQPWMQVTLLNYFRFSSGAYCEKIHALLNDPAQDDEVRFACLRYLGRYPYPPAYADLLRYATPSENARWEYAAIASSVLASYPGAETAAVLERNLYHPNWYIRFNASKSLEQLGFGYDRIEAAGYSGPVLEVSCQYKTMSKFGETVSIQAAITQYNGVRMTLHYDVFDKATGEVRCTGDSRHCFINSDGHPAILRRCWPEFDAALASHVTAEK